MMKGSGARHYHTDRPEPTAMAAAFLRALVVWAERGGGCNGAVVIPTGKVSARELVQVITALKCAGNMRRAS
ncbi:MAG: hypothetical protein ACLP19_27195 [Xanthobacteraceae bacterium]